MKQNEAAYIKACDVRNKLLDAEVDNEYALLALRDVIHRLEPITNGETVIHDASHNDLTQLAEELDILVLEFIQQSGKITMKIHEIKDRLSIMNL